MDAEIERTDDNVEQLHKRSSGDGVKSVVHYCHANVINIVWHKGNLFRLFFAVAVFFTLAGCAKSKASRYI